MKITGKYIILSAVVVLLQRYAVAGQVIDQVYHKHSYPGSRDRQYAIFLPNNNGTDQPLPLVIVLHGCNQTNRDIMHDTRFNELAEAEKFIVVYPFITSYDGLRSSNCWGYWFDNEIHEGQGEVADIAGIIAEVQNNYPVDPHRIHITGLSSGGAMATDVMVAYSEIIASGAPAAGIAYGETSCAVRGVCLSFSWFDPSTWSDWWAPQFETTDQTEREMATEMGTENRLVPILILHSTSDQKVNITAARNNAAAWAKLFMVDMTTPIAAEDGTTEGRHYHHCRYGHYGTTSAIETFFVDGPEHGWVGGAKGTYSDPDGPDWTAIAWAFFKTHPMLEQ